MSENKRKLDGSLVGFEQTIMDSVKDKMDYQKRLDEFLARQNSLYGKKSEIHFCCKCNSTELVYQEEELPLKTNNNRFKRVKLMAAVCLKCGEKHYTSKEIEQLVEIIDLIDSYYCEDNNAVETQPTSCKVCESDNMDNVELEVYLISTDSKFISVTIQEDYCTRCNAVNYADEGDQMAIDHLKYFLLTLR
ncbi:hypothetical protein [Paenibacillus algicola]|uniref:hypothetical protein n=1 Tax=Paenibacillus algicola TaxID=2565926 RepID=UPI0010FF2230|nr:hypothetical protein [Paenibacillus algicola]